jgi:hypothetical protein
MVIVLYNQNLNKLDFEWKDAIHYLVDASKNPFPFGTRGFE